MIRRRLTFPAKQELFHGRGFKGRLLAWFLRASARCRSTGPAAGPARAAWITVIQVLRDGKLLGIYPEGTRSPDGRLYKGKTGVARLVLQAGVPVIPVAMINTEFVPSAIPKIPTMRHPVIRIGRPLDFTAYAAAGNDREVLRWVTDQIMDEVMSLSGQEYVDAYGTSVKAALAEGKPRAAVQHRAPRCGPAGAPRARGTAVTGKDRARGDGPLGRRRPAWSRSTRAARSRSSTDPATARASTGCSGTWSSARW